MGGARYVDLNGSGLSELEKTGAGKRLVSYQFKVICALRFVSFLKPTWYSRGGSIITLHNHRSAFSLEIVTC